MKWFIKNELEDQQKAIYLAQVATDAGPSSSSVRSGIPAKSGGNLVWSDALASICDTPALFMEDYQGASGKLDSLQDLLVQVADGGHRVLIFSQFKGMLEKIEQNCQTWA